MAMPVRVMDHWINRYQSVIDDRITSLREQQSADKKKSLDSKRSDFYDANGIRGKLEDYQKAIEEKERAHDDLLSTLDFMFNEANKGDISKGKYTYSYNVPRSVRDFQEQFDKLILRGFDKWWEENTEEGKQIKELREMRKHVMDAVYASATPKNLLDGLSTVMKSLNADVLLNGGAKPLLEELNEVVIQPK
tara:strand:- start:129 stop:704 length:576 start_codon:yes stop_codon:yes gene_type:complete